MKLNPDAVRNILLFLEENISYEDEAFEAPQKRTEFVPYQIITDKYFSDLPNSEVSYALELLLKEGYIETIGKPIYLNGMLEMAKINGLTWKGHELLDNVRNDDSWKLVKKIASKIGGVSLGVLSTVANEYATTCLVNPSMLQTLLNEAAKLPSRIKSLI